MKIAIILVNYNGKQYNAPCIDSILACTDSYDKKIYVADNASTDDSMQLLREQYGENSKVELIPLDDNYGFSYANNVGIS
jgi:GT2 family glycosyltransferase